jgi:large subunit ribosomal protein L38e
VKKSRKGDTVKIKARTKRYLYTLKVEASKAEELISQLPCKKIVYIDEGRVVEKK